MKTAHFKKIEPFFFATLIIGLSFALYSKGANIFFIADDFIWIERAKFKVDQSFLSIFNVESHGLYYDPLIHLIFWLNYKLGGMNLPFYHYVDIFIHSLNASLIAYLSFLLTKNRWTALLGGLIFSVYPTNADTVFWPSSRPDSLACFFYLAAIISYVLHLEKNNVRYYVLSITAFILALCAKSTPVILPFIVLIIDSIFSKNQFKKTVGKISPFFAITIIYLIALKAGSNLNSKMSSSFSGLNFSGFFKSLAVLFFPESLIVTNEKIFLWSAVILALLFVSFVLSGRFPKALFIAFSMMFLAIAPILLLKMSFVYVYEDNPALLLGSACHRLYFSMAGFSIFSATLILHVVEWSISTKWIRYSFLSIFMVMLIIFSNISVVKRGHLWQKHGLSYKEIAANINKLKKGGVQDFSEVTKLYVTGNLYLDAFKKAMFRVILDNGGMEVHHIKDYKDIPSLDSSIGRITVVALSKKGSLTLITQSIQAYQALIQRCRFELSNDSCKKELSLNVMRLDYLIN